MKTYIVLGNTPWLVVQMLLALRLAGAARCVVIGGERLRCLRWSRLCSSLSVLALDGADDQRVLSEVEKFGGNARSAMLLAADCDGARIVNRLRPLLQTEIGLVPDAAMLEILDDKWHFHQFAQAHGFSVPKTLHANSKREFSFDDLSAQLGLPFVIKPVSLQGADGVHIVRSQQYFEDVIQNNADYDFPSLVAQEYIPGADMGVDLLAKEGRVLAYAIQRRNGEAIEFVRNTYLETVLFELARACRFTGLMNLDVRYDVVTGRTCFLEANPRIWASHSASAWCGLNFVAEGLAPTSAQVKTLTAGVYESDRHPLGRPSLWLAALLDRGVKGRMLRATMFDFYLMPRFLSSLPGRLRKRKSSSQQVGQAAWNS